MPLIRTKIDVHKDGFPGGLGPFGGKKCRAFGRFLRKSSSRNLECSSLGYWGGHDIINRDFDIGAIVTVEGQRQAIRRFDSEHGGAGAMPNLARNVLRDNAFTLEEIQNEIAGLVVTERRQQSRLEPKPMSANRNVRGAATDVSGKTFDLDERHVHLVRVQVNARAAHRDQVNPARAKLGFRFGRLGPRWFCFGFRCHHFVTRMTARCFVKPFSYLARASRTDFWFEVAAGGASHQDSKPPTRFSGSTKT
jgi:hypothetical protein